MALVTNHIMATYYLIGPLHIGPISDILTHNVL